MAKMNYTPGIYKIVKPKTLKQHIKIHSDIIFKTLTIINTIYLVLHYLGKI